MNNTVTAVHVREGSEGGYLYDVYFTDQEGVNKVALMNANNKGPFRVPKMYYTLAYTIADSPMTLATDSGPYDAFDSIEEAELLVEVLCT